MIKFWMCCYALFLPFSYAFAVSPIVSVPVIVSMPLIFCALTRLYYLQLSDVMLPTFLVLLTIASLVLNSAHLDFETSFNHLCAIIYVFLILYPSLLVGLRAVLATSYWRQRFAFSLAVAASAASMLAIWQFTSMNIIHITLPDMPSLIDAESYDALQTVNGARLQRARSFARESAHFTMCLMVAVPLFVAFAEGVSSRFIFIVTGLSLLGWITTLSVAGFFAGVSVLLVAYARGANRSTWYAAITFVLMAVAVIIIPETDFGRVINDLVFGKFQTSSYYIRRSRIDSNLSLWTGSGLVQLLVGFGPGYYVGYRVEAVIGFYLLVVTQWGIIGVVVFSIWFYKSAIQLYLDKSKRAGWLLAALVALLIFFISISDYYLPWVALCLASSRVGVRSARYVRVL